MTAQLHILLPVERGSSFTTHLNERKIGLQIAKGTVGRKLYDVVKLLRTKGSSVLFVR